MGGIIEFAILGVLALVLALVLVMMWEIKNMGKMIMDKMDEVIKSIKDEKPTSSGEKSCNDNESNASTMTNGEVRWSEISPSELTPAQLERMGLRLHLTPGVMRFHEDLVRSFD